MAEGEKVLERNKTMQIQFSTGESTTIKSAQSKKCRMLAKVRSGEMHPKVAKKICEVDYLLSTVCSEKDIDNAEAGLSPKRGGGKNATKFMIEID